MLFRSARFDSEFFATALADRTGYDSWQAGGAHETAQRAHGLWRQLLAQDREPHLEAALREALRASVARRSVELRDAQLFTSCSHSHNNEQRRPPCI